MKMLKEKSKKVAKSKADLDDLDEMLDGMDRDELKAYIKENDLEVVVKKSDEDDDIVAKIKKASKSGAEEDDSEDTADDDDEADASDEDDKDNDADADDDDEEEEVDLEAMDRGELKAFIKKNELEVTVKKSDSDDDLRVKIVEAVEALKKSDDDDEDDDGKEADAEDDDEDADADEDSDDSDDSDDDSDDDEDNVKEKSPLAWMYKGKSLDKEVKKAGNFQGGYAPEFWVTDGDTRIIDFLDDDPVVGLYMYSVKDGKRWKKVTQPPTSKDDRFALAGKRPFFNLVYEIIDRKGYVDKKGKKIKNTRKFWLVTDKMHKQIQHLRVKMGGLTKKSVEVHREGGKQPLYMLSPDDSLGKVPSEIRKQPRLSKDIAKYYAPPSQAEQRRLIGMLEEAEQKDD